jgi:hypothetical protein
MQLTSVQVDTAHTHATGIVLLGLRSFFNQPELLITATWMTREIAIAIPSPGANEVNHALGFLSCTIVLCIQCRLKNGTGVFAPSMHCPSVLVTFNHHPKSLHGSSRTLLRDLRQPLHNPKIEFCLATHPKNGSQVFK